VAGLPADQVPDIISKKSARPAPDGEVTVEAELSDPGSILWGRVDRIDRIGSTTRVVDLKTGLKQGQPTEDQKRQLLLYAVLVERTRGEWPAEIAIENASGEQMASPLDPAEAEAALAEVLAAADDFNRRIDESGAFDARPSAETCRWCAYRVVCDSYWSAVRVDWEHRSFLGEVTGSGTSGEGAFVDLRLESPVDATSSSVHLTGLPAKPQSDSVWFAAVDVRGLVDPKDARARWSSRIRSW
jgi:CRISPR/Cas system-associated exonuclease Cas4 (RecB family)